MHRSHTSFLQWASSKFPTFAAHAAFVPTGVVTVLLGPLLPVLSAHWGLNDAQAGYLFTAQFAASTLGVAVSGFLVSRLGFRFAMIGGLVMMALGTGSLLATEWPLGVACVACYGIGLGLTIPAANLLVAERNPENRGAALNLLNFSWSAGAVSCPFLVAAFQRSIGILPFLHWLAAALIFISIVIGGMSLVFREDKAFARQDSAEPPIVLLKHRFTFILGAMFFLYVGTENAVGGWSASYAKRISVQPGTLWAMTPSFFYGALLMGRGVAPLILRGTGETKLARAGLMISCLGIVALISSRTMTAVLVSITITGMGLSSVYPITIAMLSHKFGSAAPRVSALMFTLGNVGGATLPWLVGFTSAYFGSLKTGLVVTLVAALLMLASYSADRRVEAEHAN